MSIERIYYENGVLESEVFINGVMEGQYKSYYNSQDIKPIFRTKGYYN